MEAATANNSYEHRYHHIGKIWTKSKKTGQWKFVKEKVKRGPKGQEIGNSRAEESTFL